MVPKSSQNSPKVIPKQLQSHPKMMPKSSQNDPKVIPKWPRSNPQVTPVTFMTMHVMHVMHAFHACHARMSRISRPCAEPLRHRRLASRVRTTLPYSASLHVRGVVYCLVLPSSVLRLGCRLPDQGSGSTLRLVVGPPSR